MSSFRFLSAWQPLPFIYFFVIWALRLTGSRWQWTNLSFLKLIYRFTFNDSVLLAHEVIVVVECTLLQLGRESHALNFRNWMLCVYSSVQISNVHLKCSKSGVEAHSKATVTRLPQDDRFSCLFASHSFSQRIRFGMASVGVRRHFVCSFAMLRSSSSSGALLPQPRMRDECDIDAQALTRTACADSKRTVINAASTDDKREVAAAAAAAAKCLRNNSLLSRVRQKRRKREIEWIIVAAAQRRSHEHVK